MWALPPRPEGGVEGISLGRMGCTHWAFEDHTAGKEEAAGRLLG